MYRRLYGVGKGVAVGKGKGKGGDSCGAGAKGKGGGGSSSKSLMLPKGMRNKAKYSKASKKRPGSAPAASRTTCIIYGGRKNKESTAWDRTFLRFLFSDVIDEIEKNEKEEEEEEEECRVPEKELEKLKELVVKKVNFHIQGKKKEGEERPKKPGNAKKHHTDMYRCCTCKDKCTCEGKNKLPVLRRGQEFKITITFNRPYNVEQDDLILIVDPDPENTGKSMLSSFKLDEVRDKPFTDGEHWAARIMLRMPEKNALKLAIFIPGNVVVGEWELRVKTSLNGEVKKLVYRHPKKFTVLFNPWLEQDQVHYTDDKADLNEYILNQKGSAYYGCANYPQAKAWDYGQFEKDILQISLSLLRKAFGFKMTSAMADPVKVARALSRIVNSQGDEGVLTGNWSGDYDDGVKPSIWSSSTDILKQHAQDGQPVKFGQCWVFSHVLTAVCRSLGLPCRSVTNFDSAHDTDGSCTIDCFFNENGDDLPGMKTDSIWNFHVWNEVWILRPDIEGRDCNGWHVIDATPQEMSDGEYQCGPCPVKAVINGWIELGYDTAFVFSEVNADEVHWVVQANGEKVRSALKKKKVGNRISTKPANGKPHQGNMNFWTFDDPNLRMDLTDCYKHKEGTEEERLAVRRAVRQSGAQGVYSDSMDIQVDFDEVQQKMVGEDLEVTVLVKNVCQEVKDVEINVRARSTNYWNDSDNDKEICKEKPGTKHIPAGGQEKVKIIVPSSMYTKACDDSMNIFIYAVARDVKMNMPYSTQQAFKLGIPDLEVKCPDEADEKQVVTVSMTVTNPLDVPLTSCMVTMKGDLYQSEDDENLFESFFFSCFLDHRDLQPKETVTIPLKMYWQNQQEEEDSEEEDSDGEDDGEVDEPGAGQEEKCVTQSFEFSSHELYPMTGTCTIKCCEHH